MIGRQTLLLAGPDGFGRAAAIHKGRLVVRPLPGA